MLGEPAAHHRVRFEVGQRVEQRQRAAALVKVSEGVGSDPVVLFKELEGLASTVDTEDRDDRDSSIPVLVAFERRFSQRDAVALPEARHQHHVDRQVTGTMVTEGEVICVASTFALTSITSRSCLHRCSTALSIGGDELARNIAGDHSGAR
jgi:hypothetical protein